MNNNIIVLMNDYKEFKFNSNVIESLRFASNRWGCTFCEITKLQEPFINEKLTISAKLLWNRLLIMENFINYDKVLCIDTDVIINSKSPNIFEELDSDSDLAVVLDGNPGRFKNDFFIKSFVNTILNINIEVYSKNIPNFNFEEYSNKYFNGVVLFNPKNIKENIQKFKNFILNNNEILNLLFQNGNFVDQNLPNAWFTSSPEIKIKYIKNEWNWIAPDIEQEYDMFLGPMIPWIYHFCGTNLSKERLESYDRWK